MVTEKKKLNLTLLNFTATTCAWGLHVKENIVIVVIDKGSKFLCDIETEKYFFEWKEMTLAQRKVIQRVRMLS